MLTKKQKEEKEKIIDMMCATARRNGLPGDRNTIAALALRLHRTETALHRLALDECNNPTYDEKKQERLENLAEKLVKEALGCECETQRDPRGFCIRMHLVDEDGDVWSNSWDGVTTGLAW